MCQCRGLCVCGCPLVSTYLSRGFCGSRVCVAPCVCVCMCLCCRSAGFLCAYMKNDTRGHGVCFTCMYVHTHLHVFVHIQVHEVLWCVHSENDAPVFEYTQGCISVWLHLCSHVCLCVSAYVEEYCVYARVCVNLSTFAHRVYTHGCERTYLTLLLHGCIYVSGSREGHRLISRLCL